MVLEWLLIYWPRPVGCIGSIAHTKRDLVSSLEELSDRLAIMDYVRKRERGGKAIRVLEEERK